MTNSSPQNPGSSEPSSYTPEEVKHIRQQVRRRTSRDVSEEWIAAVVAFGTIGAILFWSFGGRKSNFNFLSQNNFFSSPAQTKDANLNLDLNSDDSLDIEDSESSDLFSFSGNQQSEGISSSDSSDFDSFSTNNLNQPKTALPLIGSVNRITKPVIPRIDAESEIDLDKSDLNSESDTSASSEADDTSSAADVETDTETDSNAISETDADTDNDETADAGSETDPDASSEADTDVIAFSKLSDQHWSYPFISKLAAENLLPNAQGFKPDDPINRAEMATLISSAFKDSSITEAPKQFTDVTANSKVTADINKAVSLGFMNGYSEGDFRPEQNIPRYQVLVALATGLGLEPSGNPETILQNFGDRSELPEWSLNKVAAATEAGIAINRPGFALNSLKPEQSATRAEVASMIYQALAQSGKVPNLESEYIVDLK